jgi:AraC-like DNA-binding protein
LAAGLVILVAVLLVWLRRTRQQLDMLMRRIDDLEASGEDPKAQAPRRTSGDGVGTPWRPGSDLVANPSRDVLAGRTSFVRRVVGGDDQPVSLGAVAVARVHERIEECVTPADLADELAVSLRTLERGVALELGCTPRQLILALKMREARRLLESGAYRVNEVASQLGFATHSHFSRSFRTFYRVPPSAVTRSASD